LSYAPVSSIRSYLEYSSTRPIGQAPPPPSHPHFCKNLWHATSAKCCRAIHKLPLAVARPGWNRALQFNLWWEVFHGVR